MNGRLDSPTGFYADDDDGSNSGLKYPRTDRRSMNEIKADWLQPINCCTRGQECIPNLYKGSDICDNKT